MINNHNPTIICLQEVIQDSEELQALVSTLGYQASTSLGPNNKPGIAILYKNHIEATITDLDPGRILKLKTADLIIYNVYGPSGNQNQLVRKEFINQNLMGHILQEENLPILIGDWNCITHAEDAEQNQQRKISLDLRTLIQILEYTDAFKALNQRNDYTFQRSNMSASRLDRAYLPPEWKHNLVSCQHFPSLSDHKALHISLNQPDNQPRTEKRQTYWKLNTRILDHPSYPETFQSFWDNTIEEKEEDKSWADWWEERFKVKVKGFLQNLSKERINFRKTTRYFLYQALEKAIKLKKWDQVDGLKANLNQMMLEDLEGIIIRSGNKDIIDEEKGSIYHLCREIKRAKTGNLNKLKINGVEVEDKGRIVNELTYFYTALFNGQHRTVEGSLQPVDTGIPFQEDLSHLEEFLSDLPTLTDQQKDTIQQPIQLQEMIAALKTSPKHRAPGLDGLPHEFYKKNIATMGPSLMKVLQEQLDRGELTPSGKEGVTRLIPKTTDTPTMQQLRPITLLNCDYKLMSKILATRMNKLLPKILKSSQLCSRNPRTILSGVTDIISGMEHIRKKKGKGYLLSLDFYKAFDKANISLIVKIMEKMGFGAVFTSWIKTLHKGAGTRLILGELSERITAALSLRQGDNSAMPLFIIGMEPLLLTLDRNIEGLQVGPTSTKSLSYVDDAQVLSGKEEDLEKTDQIFRRYEALSGMVLSREKTKIMGFGEWEGRDHWPLQWATPTDQIKAFGITFCSNLSRTTRFCWEECQTNVRKSLLSWGKRSIQTLQQKSFIIGTYALSKIWYIAQVLHPPAQVIGEIEKTCRKYLWLGRLEHLPWEELMNSKMEGGLGIPHIKNKCDALMLRHTYRGLTDPTSRAHLSYWLGHHLREIFPDLGGNMPTAQVPPYFKKIGNLAIEGSRYDLTIRSKTKKIYQNYTSTPPVPRIQTTLALPWDEVYQRVWNQILTVEQQDLAFTLINNIYPTKERLHRLRQHATGMCTRCEVTDNVQHSFLECQDVQGIWAQVQQQLPDILNIRNDGPEKNWIQLSFQNSDKEKEKIFVIGTILEYIHQTKKHKKLPEARDLGALLKTRLKSHKATTNNIRIQYNL